MTLLVTHSILLVWLLSLVRQACGATRISAPITHIELIRAKTSHHHVDHVINNNAGVNGGGEERGETTARDTTAFATATSIDVTTSACPYLTECQADDGCAKCLSAVLPALTFVQSTQGEAEVEATFFQTLSDTPSCTNMTTSALTAGPILYGALVELYSTSGGPTSCSNATDQVYVFVCEVSTTQHHPRRCASLERIAASKANAYATQSCRDSYACTRHSSFSCAVRQVEEFVCFLDADCRTCVSDVMSSAHEGVTLDSAACRATNATLLAKLVDASCDSFPACSFSKRRCSNSTMCAECLSLLTAGDGAGAASRCTTGESAMLIDSTVYWCVDSTPTSCTFWQTRCLADKLCGSCLRQMNFGRSVGAIVAASTTPECAVLRNRRTSSAASDAFETLWNVASMCPEDLAFSDCGTLVMRCVLTYDQCVECVNGSKSES